MSSPESHVLTADDSNRARVDVIPRESLRLSVVRGGDEAAVPYGPESERIVARSVTGLVVALHATPLLGVAGAIALYWSTGTHRDVMFAVGMLLLLCAVAAFQKLRARLIRRFELPAHKAGLSKRQAHEDAVRAVDRLIRASLRLERSGSGGAKRWPPISLS